MKINRSLTLTIGSGVLAISTLGFGGAALASGPAGTAETSSSSTESDADQAAQDAACEAAGVDPAASNIQYDDATGVCSLDGDGDNEREEADVVGTINAPAEGSDSKEDAALATLATVTEAEAGTAATDAVPGTAGAIGLEDEDGFVVWEVEVTQDNGTVVEVLIDAGDSSVLAQETEDGDEGEN